MFAMSKSDNIMMIKNATRERQEKTNIPINSGIGVMEQDRKNCC